MAKPFRTKNWRVWAQPGGPGTETHMLGCITMDDLEEGGEDIKDLIRCFKDDGTGWEILGATKNPPDPISMTLTDLVESVASWLEKNIEAGRCEMPLYINGKLCPPYDVFAGAERWFGLEQSYIGTTTVSGLAHRDEDNLTEQAFQVTVLPKMIRGHAVGTDRVTFSGTENLNDIASCSKPRCANECGTAVAACQVMVAVADGAPASADVWISYDGGDTWAATAVDPYLGTATDLKSVVCFPVDSETTRILVAREAVGPMPAHVYYSDDYGANWTDVNLDGLGGHGAVYGGALFSFGYNFTWYVTTDGANSQIWFSSDGGATWTLQEDIARELWAIWFADESNGMVVGSGDVVYTTTDGGTTWGAATATGSADDLYHVTENAGGGAWWVGTSGGDLYRSVDFGTTWEQMDFPGDGAGAVYSLDFATKTVGFMIHSPTAATGRVYRTRDGGWSWELESATVAGELYSVIACGVNDAFSVGEVDTTALVLNTHD